MIKVCLDIVTVCPIKCRYCLYQYKDMIKPKFIKPEDFSRILNILVKEHFKYVYLYLSGEPTLHPDFWDMVARLSEAGISVNIASKLPVQLDTQKADEAIKRFDAPVHFDITIDAASQECLDKQIYGKLNINTVYANLDILANYANEKKMTVSVISVANKFNHNELPIIKLGCAMRNIPWCSKPMGFYAGASMDESDVANIAELIGTNGNSRFTIAKNKIVSKKKTCSGFLKPVIGHDGRVTICCHDFLYRNAIGNIFDQNSLLKVLESEVYKASVKCGAKMALPICKGCN